MALSDNPSSFHAHSGSSDPCANASIVAISSCAIGFQYSLSMVNVIFPPPIASWVYDHNIAPEPRFTKFPSQDNAKDVEPKASKIMSSVTSEHLSEYRSLYYIPQDYELIPPSRHEQANIPLWVFRNVRRTLEVWHSASSSSFYY